MLEIALKIAAATDDQPIFSTSFNQPFYNFSIFQPFFQYFRKKLVLESCVGNCVEDCGSHWWSTNFLKTLKEQKLSICYNIFYQLHFIDQTMWSANIQFSYSTENGHSCLKIVIVKMLEQFLSLKHRFIVHRCERGLEHRRQVKTQEVIAKSQKQKWKYFLSWLEFCFSLSAKQGG